MLVSHTRVKGIAWGITTNGSGVSFATPASAMDDGRPASVTRFLWPSHGTPDLAYVEIEGTWTTAAPVLYLHILNISMFQGTQINVSFRRAFTTTWDTPTGAVYVERLASGVKVACATVPNGGYAYTGVRVRLNAYNPVFGGASIFAGTPVDIGEIWLGQLEDVPIKNDWAVDDEDPSVTRDSDLLQPWLRRGTPRRVLRFTPHLRNLDGIYGARLGLGTDVPNAALDKITTRFNRGQQVVCIPRWTDGDFALMARSAIFGTAIKLGGFRHLRGGWYDPGQFVIREAPIPVPP
jgi:hypothetical protein